MTGLPIAVSIGDPAGIGPEVLAKAWVKRREQKLPPFFAIGDVRSISTVWKGPLRKIGEPSEAIGCFDEALPIMEVEDAGEIVPGKPNMPGARCAIASLEIAVGIVRENAASAIVTGPVSKAELYAIGFSHSGQTEFVAERCGVSPGNVAMMLAGPTLKTVCITTHVPLASVSALLTVELVVARARVTARGLQRDFGIEAPRIAMAGFNPHAGEGGALGREEIEILLPAIEQLRDEGIDIVGPLAADTMFHPRARAHYDVALCTYHDQALIPLKTLHFDDGVNMTLGLPIVRTAPDHGTAFEIAGQGLAEPGATIAAIRMAGEAAGRRAAAL
ncbi:4-hydroxythreonine-4-phosphate dehydrogenase PdxA [Sphingomonas abietis]|uniref:4-hydroxythreonine-4-phosphate dehydrogenase n=1 Tax=Sphingomonas abietis TaxID=3012344 RepID=A0ABY7NRH7_9SPHN|nr:4-hydroxythreonine-4-phosphate dehydrogenase PdxA [Sphingomonas abietis]WBO24146.1 4-hydroxythreonine-4-phosphate dehydrogenase PdxA [Sphingomonas abietis]